MIKNLPAMQETQVQYLGREDSSGEGNGNQLQYSCLENPRDRESWRATVPGIPNSRTGLTLRCRLNSISQKSLPFTTAEIPAERLTGQAGFVAVSCCCLSVGSSHRPEASAGVAAALASSGFSARDRGFRFSGTPTTPRSEATRACTAFSPSSWAPAPASRRAIYPSHFTLILRTHPPSYVKKRAFVRSTVA